MDEILEGFREESKTLIGQMTEILEDIESNLDQNQKLEEYGQLVDRIMGTAKTLSKEYKDPTLNDISNYCELCKVIGYKGSQLRGQKEFCTIVVAFLLDATEMLGSFFDQFGTITTHRRAITKTFLDRLKLISGRFDESLRGTIASKNAASTQDEINHLLKKMGV